MFPRIGRQFDDQPIVPPPPPPPPPDPPRPNVTMDDADPRVLQLRADGDARRTQLQNTSATTPGPSRSQDGTGLTPEKQELLLDLGQIALSVVGIVDPTPISDGANAVVSLLRGDFFGAAVDAVSMLPYAGDLAKIGKLPKFLKVIENAVNIAKTDARFADAIRPALQRLRDALHAAPLDSLPAAVREPLEGMRSKIDEFFGTHPAGGESFVGTLRGGRVELPGVAVRRVDYTKRPRDEYNQLRRDFDNTGRASFVRDLAGDPQKAARLREAGLSDADISMLADGRIPAGWQVHHKLPLDDGGTNDFGNLVLIKNDPYHLAITNAQNAATRGMNVGDTRQLDWPIPEGFVYPPRP